MKRSDCFKKREGGGLGLRRNPRVGWHHIAQFESQLHYGIVLVASPKADIVREARAFPEDISLKIRISFTW